MRRNCLSPILLLTTLLKSNFVLGQEGKLMQTDKREYYIGDTIKVNYSLDSLEVLYSNFGGCGSGPIYVATCHTDSFRTRTSGPTCAYLLETIEYSNQGRFEMVIDYPGIYSISFFVKGINEKPPTYENRFTQMVTTEKFSISSIKK